MGKQNVQAEKVYSVNNLEILAICNSETNKGEEDTK